ncbi:MAG TPA: hypothetical protein VHZ74_06330 [Bryobacteraceae bacterium]|nr:hypothetical protein [Bryobacteraceae bacterium]
MARKVSWCAAACHVRSILVIPGLLAASIGALHAQDPFEIHVLEYEESGPGEFTFENHTNYSGGDRTLHLTYELTAGVTENVSLGVMQLNARLPGGPLESAGWRITPHLYTPRAWHWPVDTGVTTEISFQSARWAADSRSIEIIPIVEKRFGRIQVDLNPSFGRALHGPGTAQGWAFGLAARASVDLRKRFTPAIEYYSDWGRLPGFAPLDAQVHQVLPGGDFRFSKNVVWSTGVGIGTTPAGNRLVYKSRLEILFGGRHKPRH